MEPEQPKGAIRAILYERDEKDPNESTDLVNSEELARKLRAVRIPISSPK